MSHNHITDGVTKRALERAEAQLKAYNARDLVLFLDCFSDDVKAFNYPNTLLLEGRESMVERYTQRFQDTYLWSHITSCIGIGNKVIHEEKIRMNLEGGVGVWHVTAIYTISEVSGLIDDVRFISGPKVVGELLPDNCGAPPLQSCG